ncbi:hypothetical protein NEIRO03_2191 [Nematocida sp. AWRm78]|nr:hypothetical protein NEIRO02_2412 [Nematocida sp. AWRm79]KAI5186063.1 hypothetical protein NEIRO03_2191 [Nematocida sp. AWRm78]
MQIGGLCKALKTGVMITGVLFVIGVCILTGVELVKKHVFNTSTLDATIGEIPEIDESGNIIISNQCEDNAEKCKYNSEAKVTGEYAEGSKECIHPEKSKHAEEKIPVGPEKNNKREENPKISSGSVAYDKKEDIKSNPIILDIKDAGLTIEGHSDKNNINTPDKKDVTTRQLKDLKKEVSAQLPAVPKDKTPAQLLKDLNDSMPVQLSEVSKDRTPAQLLKDLNDSMPAQLPAVSKDKMIVHLPAVSKEEVPAHLPAVSNDEIPAYLPAVSNDEIPAHLPAVSKEETPAQLPEATKKELLIPCIDVPKETSKLLSDSLQKEKADKQPDQVLKFNFNINDRFIDHEAHKKEEKQEEKQNSPKILNTDANTSFIQGEVTKDNEL